MNDLNVCHLQYYPKWAEVRGRRGMGRRRRGRVNTGTWGGAIVGLQVPPDNYQSPLTFIPLAAMILLQWKKSKPPVSFYMREDINKQKHSIFLIFFFFKYRWHVTPLKQTPVQKDSIYCNLFAMKLNYVILCKRLKINL